MPKLKTHKGARRRIHVTGSGKFMYSKIGRSHLRRKKPGRVKRDYNGMLPSDPVNVRRLRRVMPYG
ncbi:MAG: 50S ribosomal protein L35 [Chloroflexota bacterium]|nr:50S ribosomal protein L35 [Chloroflexota bacterium]